MGACIIGVLLLLAYCGSVSAHDKDGSTIAPVKKNNCECNLYNCGCCRDFEWSTAYINETICVNATYLKEDYGISITLTFNDFTVINETVSARNPPPICAATEIEELLPVDICLKIYDIDYTTEHACFMIMGKVGIVKIPIVHLGCVKLTNKFPFNGHWWQRFNTWRAHANHISVDEPFVTHI